MSGWIAIARSIQESWIWEDPWYLWAWIDLIMLANWKDKKRKTKDGVILIKRGQMVEGIHSLAMRWGVSRGRVRRFLADLQVDDMIYHQTYHQHSIITLVNYEKYQMNGTTGDTTDDTTNGTTGDTTDDTTPEKDKKKTKNIYTPEFEEFWDAYPRKIDKLRAFRAWKARLKEGFKRSDILTATKNYAIAKKDTEDEFIKYPSTFLGPSKSFTEYIKGIPKAGIKKKCDLSQPFNRRSYDDHQLRECGCLECLKLLEKREGA